MCNRLVKDPDYITDARNKARANPNPSTRSGFASWLSRCPRWEILLSKGQEWDWFGDPFFRVQILAVLFVGCLFALVFRELKIANPLINFRTLMDRNFRSACILIFCAFAVLYANTVSLPALLQSLFGYDATTSGLVLSPAGFFAIITLVVVGRLLGMGTDARYIMAVGLLLLAAGNYWFSQLNLEVSPWQVVWPRVVLIMGLSMIFAPLNVAAFLTFPRQLRPAAVGLLALLRNEGGSVGTSLAQTIHERREQFHVFRLNEHLNSLNHSLTDALQQTQALFLGKTGDAHASYQMTLQLLQNVRNQQAAALAYFDVFWICAVAAAGLVLLLPLMRRSRAAKGAHIAAE